LLAAKATLGGTTRCSTRAESNRFFGCELLSGIEERLRATGTTDTTQFTVKPISETTLIELWCETIWGQL
jgi:hypothetical protein